MTTTDRTPPRFCRLALPLFATLSTVAQADVVFDGSLGPIGELSGDMVIGEEWGTREGANLFHSFYSFNIFAGESVLFTSSFAGQTDHVIARVTGGRESLIDGPLGVDIPGASLWLVNPSGLVFGEGAMVDVQGAFTATTADYLLLDNGGRFAADTTDLSGTVLTMGNPTGFGFLGANPASIRLEGADIDAGPGGSVTLVGGDIGLQDSRLAAEGGRVDLAAVTGPGEVMIRSDGLDVSGMPGRADIQLSGSTIDVDGNRGGRIHIVGGQFVVEQGSAVTARSEDGDGRGIEVEADDFVLDSGSVIDTSTTGTGDAGRIRLAITDSATIAGGSSVLANTRGRGDAGTIDVTVGGLLSISSDDTNQASGLFANTRNRGDAGAIDVTAGAIEMTGNASVETRSSSIGNGGRITMTADQSITLFGILGGRDSGGVLIRQGTLDAGSDATNAGSIHVSAPLVTLDGHFTIQSDTRGSADGGSIRLDVDDLLMTGSAQITAETGNDFRGGDIGDVGEASSILINATNDITLISESKDTFERANQTYISVNAQKGGRSGYLTLNARTIFMDGANLLATSNQTAAEGGAISVTASESLTMTNQAVIESAINDTFSAGADIIINTGVLSMDNAAQISSNTLQSNGNLSILTGQAGSIFITADQLSIQNSVIEANSCGCSAGAAGDIFVNVSDLISIEGIFDVDGTVFSNAGILSVTYGGETGGNIFVSAPRIVMANNGTISTSSPATRDFIQDKFPDLLPGNAGRIDIEADMIHLSSGASIATSAVEAAGGVISLAVNDLILIEDAAITAEALGVTPGDNGGNVFISDPSVIVLDNGAIVARANAGNGGNIGIRADALIPGLYGTIDASSQAGLDGQVIIDSPNQQLTSITVLDEPSLDITALIADPCAVALDEDRSSLTVEGQGGLPPMPDDYQPAPAWSGALTSPGARRSLPVNPLIAAACGSVMP